MKLKYTHVHGLVNRGHKLPYIKQGHITELSDWKHSRMYMQQFINRNNLHKVLLLAEELLDSEGLGW